MILKIPDTRLLASRKHSDSRGMLLISDLDISPSCWEKNSRIMYSSNLTMGTFRGIHTQIGEIGETKFVWCTKGSVFDISIDLRPHSNSFLVSQSIYLDPGSGVLCLPPGIGHGFQTLEDDSAVVYLILGEFGESNYRRWSYKSDAFSITLPLDVTEISIEDKNAPHFLV